MNRMDQTDVYETAYNAALELIAIGEPREESRGILIDSWPQLSTDDINDVLAEALRDALRSGVEREDIDPSWF